MKKRREERAERKGTMSRQDELRPGDLVEHAHPSADRAYRVGVVMEVEHDPEEPAIMDIVLVFWPNLLRGPVVRHSIGQIQRLP